MGLTSFQDIIQSSMGANGVRLIVPGVTVTGEFKAFYPIEDSTLTSIICDVLYTNTSTQATVGQIGTIKEGQPLLCNITSINLASGKGYLFA